MCLPGYLSPCPFDHHSVIDFKLPNTEYAVCGDQLHQFSYVPGYYSNPLGQPLSPFRFPIHMHGPDRFPPGTWKRAPMSLFPFCPFLYHLLGESSIVYTSFERLESAIPRDELVFSRDSITSFVIMISLLCITPTDIQERTVIVIRNI